MAPWRGALCAVALPTVLASCTDVARAQGAETVGLPTRPFTYRFDVRQAEPPSDRLGLDFALRYQQQWGERKRGDQRGVRAAFEASSKGFQDFNPNVHELNSMEAGVALAGRHYDAGSLTPEEMSEQLSLLSVPDSLTTPRQRARMLELQNKIFGRRQFFTFNAHYRYETTQRLDVGQHAGGVALAGEIPVLHRFLDLVPAATRSGDERRLFAPQPVRVYLALDYVHAGVGAAGDSTRANQFPRASLELAWSTYLLEHMRLRATWQAQRIFAAPAATRALGLELDSFVQLWLTHPFGQNAELLVKYADGRLPPTYESTSTTRMGFSIALQ